MSLKVGIDVTAILNRIPRGIGSYIFELISHMESVNFIKLFKLSRLKYPGRLKRLKGPGYPFFELNGKAYFMRKFDLFHGTDAYIPNAKFPTVLTVHDVYPLIKHPESRTSRKLRRALERKPTAIIVISEFAKKELLKFFPEVEAKTYVVYNGVSEFWERIEARHCLDVKQKFELDKPFFVYAGETEERKNIENLLEALSILNEDVELVITGGFLKEHQCDLAKKLGVQDRVKELGYVEKYELKCIYNLAVALIFVSLYEGFGLPLLEAMRCGTPVVASDIEVFREIGNDAFVRVNPQSPESIKEGMLKVLQDESLREQLVEKGLKNARKFSWSRTAVETAKVYNLALNYGKS